MKRRLWKLVLVSACMGLLYAAANILMMRLVKIDLDVWWFHFLLLCLVGFINTYIWQKFEDSPK